MFKSSLALHKSLLLKFLLLCGVMLGYFAYLSYEYDLLTGGVAALLTWSFFVLCTPIADAGFLLDFPLRLLFGVRMLISELVVWLLAISINLFVLLYADAYYETTLVTKILHKIILTPYPYWGVIFLSAAGTFLSIRFADELMDVIQHRERSFFHSHYFKHEMILLIFLVAIIFGYYGLIGSLDVDV